MLLDLQTIDDPCFGSPISVATLGERRLMYKLGSIQESTAFHRSAPNGAYIGDPVNSIGCHLQED
jgi:hypothetical protein